MSDEQIGQQPAQNRKDVNVRALYKFLLIMAVVCGIILVGMWAEFAYLNAESKAEDPQLSPLAVKPDQLPPEPRLLINEPDELQRVKNNEDSVLHSYGWVDKSKGIVRIPIEDAIKIVAKRKDLQSIAPAPSAPQTQTAEAVQ